MPKWRADLIASSEVHSVYRQAQVKAGKDLGFTKYSYEGPLDDKTEPVCEKYVGEVKTLEEWQEISTQEQGDPDLVFLYGLHYGCRHTLIPVPDDAVSERGEREEAAEEEPPQPPPEPEPEPQPTPQPEPEPPPADKPITMADFKQPAYSPTVGRVFSLEKSDPLYQRFKEQVRASGRRSLLPVPKDMDEAEFRDWMKLTLGTNNIEQKLMDRLDGAMMRDIAYGTQELVEKTGMDLDRIPPLHNIVDHVDGKGHTKTGWAWGWDHSLHVGEDFTRGRSRLGRQGWVRKFDFDDNPNLPPPITSTGVTRKINGRVHIGFHPSDDPAGIAIHEIGHHLTLNKKIMYKMNKPAFQSRMRAMLDPNDYKKNVYTPSTTTRGEWDSKLKYFAKHEVEGGLDPTTGRVHPPMTIDSHFKADQKVSLAISKYADKELGEVMAESLLQGLRWGWDSVPQPARLFWKDVLKFYGGKMQ